MRRLSTRFSFWAIGVLACFGCRDNHSHGEGGGHDDHDDHGDDHSGHDKGGDDLPGQSVTLWTERTELFMEYQPLVVGRDVSFAAHVTEMPSFKAVKSGAVTLELTQSDGANLVGRADGPSSPGIFRPTLTPTKAGECEMRMKVEGSQLEDAFAVGRCQVFTDTAAAAAALGEEEEGDASIVYLKEQQWKTEFATAPAAVRELQPSVQANGEIRPVSGKEARLAAAVPGRVTLASPAPILGMPVKKGQLLARISARLSEGADPASLGAEVQSASAELEAAEAQLARSERLFAGQAVAERQVDEARARARVAKARLGAATGRLRQYTSGAAGIGGVGPGAFRVRSPIDGTLVSVDVASGETVEEGKLLFSVIDLDAVWVEARVFEPDIPKVAGAQSAWFTIDGYDDPFVVNESNGRLIAVGRVIAPQTRTVPVIFEVDNKDGKLRIGQFAKVRVATGELKQTLAIPASAVLQDAGKAIVYVHVEGEAFDRRVLATGLRDRGWVEILSGVEPGERVVVVGAYEIKLASASGVIPAHGHAH